MPEMVKNAKKAKKAKHLQGANAQSATTKAYPINMAGANKGGRRCSPPGATGQNEGRPADCALRLNPPHSVRMAGV